MLDHLAGGRIDLAVAASSRVDWRRIIRRWVSCTANYDCGHKVWHGRKQEFNDPQSRAEGEFAPPLAEGQGA